MLECSLSIFGRSVSCMALKNQFTGLTMTLLDLAVISAVSNSKSNGRIKIYYANIAIFLTSSSHCCSADWATLLVPEFGTTNCTRASCQLPATTLNVMFNMNNGHLIKYNKGKAVAMGVCNIEEFEGTFQRVCIWMVRCIFLRITTAVEETAEIYHFLINFIPRLKVLCIIVILKCIKSKGANSEVKKNRMNRFWWAIIIKHHQSTLSVLLTYIHCSLARPNHRSNWLTQETENNKQQYKSTKSKISKCFFRWNAIKFGRICVLKAKRNCGN